MKKLLFTLTIAISTQLNAQIGVDWVRNYGGSNNESAYASDIYANGDIILLGKSLSNSGDVHGNLSTTGSSWLIKMTINGDTLWTKCILDDGTQPWGVIRRIKVTSDNGFIIFNQSQTIKFNASGIQQWTLNTFYADLVVNNDGTFIGLKRLGGDIDFISSNGNLINSIQNTTLSISGNMKLIKTNDGGFVIGAEQCHYNCTDNIKNIRIISLNSSGSLIWDRFYGGLDDTYGGEKIIELKQLNDGNYLVGGITGSQVIHDIPSHYGDQDVWIFKLDVNGDFIWNKCFGSDRKDELKGLEINSTDEIYFVANRSSYFDNNSNVGDYLVNPTINPVNINGTARGSWLVKLSSIGNIVWQGRYGSNSTVNGISNIPASIKIRNNGTDIIVFGESSDTTGNNDENNGMKDTWAIKFKQCLNQAPVINEVPLNVNCTGFSAQLEVQYNANTAYQWYTLNGFYNYYNYLQGQNNSFLNNSFLDHPFGSQIYPSETYALLSVVDNCPVISTKVYQPTFIPLPQNQNICIVGLDQTTGKNKIVWEKEQTQVISSYNVYRENSQTGSFDFIGSKNYTDSSIFLDINSNPIQQAHRYKISYTDTCGNESNTGNPHQTMHLTINQGVGTNWNLIWTPYSGITYPSYNVYRGTNTSNMTLLSTVASNITSFTDNNAPSGFVYYQVEIVSPTNCNPTKSYNNSLSNISTNDPSYLEINETSISPISIYPNPASNQITISYAGQIQKIEIVDAKGAKVYSSIENKKEILLPSSIQTGYYLVLVHTQEGVYQKELIVNK